MTEIKRSKHAHLAPSQYFRSLDDAIVLALGDAAPIDRFSLGAIPTVQSAAQQLAEANTEPKFLRKWSAELEIKHRLTALSKRGLIRYDVSKKGWVLP